MPPEAIGKVEKVVGHVTLIHNGVAGPLHVGDPVYKTDVVETGANSSCGIAFPDGTALDLVNNTRMALNEYNYSPNSASNGAIFSLVEGTFAFVAGQVAHTGEGMKINTPVATMGIRGTVGLFRTEPTVINSNLGHVWSVFLHEDIDGSHHLGRIAFIDQDPSSPTFGQVFYLLDSSEYIAYLEPQGPGLPPHVRLEPISNSKVFDDRHFYDDLGQILNAYQTGTVNPKSVPGTPGSGDNPNLLFQQQFQDEFGHPLFNSAGPIGSSGPFTQFIPPGGPNLPPIPVMPGQNPNAAFERGDAAEWAHAEWHPPPPASTHFIWTSAGAESWSQALADWNQGAAPNSPHRHRRNSVRHVELRHQQHHGHQLSDRRPWGDSQNQSRPVDCRSASSTTAPSISIPIRYSSSTARRRSAAHTRLRSTAAAMKSTSTAAFSTRAPSQQAKAARS